MRSPKPVAAGLALLVLAACGGGEGPAAPAFAPCASEPPPAVEVENLPSWLSLPDDIRWHETGQLDVFEVAEGTSRTSVETLNRAFADSFERAGAQTLFDEVEPLDSELTARHDGHLAFVIIQAECEGRRKVKVSVRPDTLNPGATRTDGRPGRAGGGAAPS